MPYIKEVDRKRFGRILEYLKKDVYQITVGELNYLITSLCLFYLETNKESYQSYNDIIGALECAKLEMYRRRTAKYEDSKKELNGEVY